MRELLASGKWKLNSHNSTRMLRLCLRLCQGSVGMLPTTMQPFSHGKAISPFTLWSCIHTSVPSSRDRCIRHGARLSPRSKLQQYQPSTWMRVPLAVTSCPQLKHHRHH